MKQSGLGDNLYIAGVNVSGDITSLGRVGGGPAPWQVTGIDKFAVERIGLLRDGGIEAVAYLNTATDGTHDKLKTLPRTDQVISYFRGTALGKPAACLVGKQANYDATRGEDGSLTFAVQALANGFGLEWGNQLTTGDDSLAAANVGPGVDFGSASSFGAQFYLHAFSFTGTSYEVIVEHSDDNGAVDPYAEVIGSNFETQTSAPHDARVQTARDEPIKRWLRYRVFGTFTELTLAVVAAHNDTEVVF